MRIHRLRLRNFRGIDEEEIEPAADGVTIVQGPNEVGKSTLLEAVDLVFRKKDSSRAKEVRTVQPVGEDVGPEVELEVETGPYRFTYFKRFIRDKETTLEVHEPKRRSLSGEKAHERARAILDETLDTALWRALRVDQGVGIEQVDLDDQSALSKALDQAAGSALVGDREIDIYQAVRDEYLEHWTKTGNLRKSARERREEVEELAAEVSGLEETLQDLEDDVQRIASLQEEREQKQDTLAEKRDEMGEWEERWQEVRSLREEVDKKEEARDVARERLDRARERLDQREDLHDEVESLSSDLDDHEDTLEAHEPRLEAARARVEELDGAREAAEEVVDALEAHLSQRRDDEELLRKRKEVEDLRARLGTIEEAREEVEAAEEVLDGTALDEDLLGKIRDAHYELRSLEQRLKEGGPRVEATFETPAAVELDGEERTVEAGASLDEHVREAFQLEVADALDLRVSAGRSATELEEEVEAARERYRALLDEAGVDDLDEAEAAYEERTTAQRKRENARARLDDLLEGETLEDLRSRIQELEDEVDSLSSDRGAAPPVPDSLAEAERLRERAERWGKRARAARDRTVEEHRQARGRLEDVEERYRTLDQEREVTERRLETVRASLEEARGEASDEELRQEVEAKEEELQEAESDLQGARDRLDEENPEEVKARYRNVEKVVERLEEELSGIDTTLTDLKARVSERGGDGLHEELEEKRRQHEQARRDWSRYKQRIDALKLLHDTLAEEREKAKRVYVEPLKDRIDRLGKIVYGEDFEVRLGEDLAIEQRILEGNPIDWEDLSGGAQEQLSLLARLAAARIVSDGEEPGVPLFVDDALGYTDPDRLEAMNAVLGTAAEDIQVLVLTCYPERYQGVGGAKVVRMD